MKRSIVLPITVGRSRFRVRLDRYRLFVLLLAGALLFPGLLWANSLVPSFESTRPTGAPASRVQIPTSGPFRAIVVFVRFRDDTAAYDGCAPSGHAWSVPDVLPDVASKVLAASPTPPFPENSLTAYFYQQSQGRFLFYGDVYPHVVATEKTEAEYRVPRGRKLRLSTLTKEILGRLDADPEFDLGAYDANDDGFIDYVFFVVRRLNDSELSDGNPSGTSFIGHTSRVPEYGNDPQHLKMVDGDYSGSYVRYLSSGIIFPEINLIRLMAHEFGHDLWLNTPLQGAHVNALGWRYGVPANGTDRVGYVLMAGYLGGRDMRGDETISAFERDLLNDGWITCPVLTTEGRVRVTDLYSDNTANCYKLEVPVGAMLPRNIYLTNRQRIGAFDRLRTNACTVPQNDHGLRTTGLLVTAGYRGRFAVLPADNTLHLSIERSAYQGDMYGPGTAIQLTPWTRPNVNGYTRYPGYLVLEEENFQAIDNIGYTGGANGEMAFDYVKDFRRRPILREDSWMGDETEGYDFSSPVVVTHGSTLTINTTLSFSSTLRIEEGSTVVIDTQGDVTLTAGSRLDMADGVRLFVLGKLTRHGSITMGRGAEIMYARERTVEIEDMKAGIEGESTVVAEPEDEEGGPGAGPGDVEAASYPNPFNAQATITYALPQAVFVTLRVYDARGGQVATLVNGRQAPGRHQAVFDGSALPSGVYVYRLKTDLGIRVQKMVLVK